METRASKKNIKKYESILKVLKSSMALNENISMFKFSTDFSVSKDLSVVLQLAGIIKKNEKGGWKWIGGNPNENMAALVLKTFSSRNPREKNTSELHVSILSQLKELKKDIDRRGDNFRMSNFIKKHNPASSIGLILSKNGIIKKTGHGRAVKWEWVGITPNIKMAEKLYQEVEKHNPNHVVNWRKSIEWAKCEKSSKKENKNYFIENRRKNHNKIKQVEKSTPNAELRASSFSKKETTQISMDEYAKLIGYQRIAKIFLQRNKITSVLIDN
ncbi:MAG: hypothetical protein N4A45_10435 [Flavobacteriales bacterium]|jgi:hypothetical protein|nr:hypothetical protein [Flavobacteriales bacterium]